MIVSVQGTSRNWTLVIDQSVDALARGERLKESASASPPPPPIFPSDDPLDPNCVKVIEARSTGWFSTSRALVPFDRDAEITGPISARASDASRGHLCVPAGVPWSSTPR